MPEHQTENQSISDEELAELQRQAMELIDRFPPTDPRSIRYVRSLNRPAIRWRLAIAFVMGGIFAVLISLWIPRIVPPLAGWRSVLPWITLGLYLFLFRRFIAVGIVRLYQRYAPDEIRNRCMFEPSCSEYTIQAIQKYGTFRGLYRSIRRMKRCNPNGGGFDPP